MIQWCWQTAWTWTLATGNLEPTWTIWLWLCSWETWEITLNQTLTTLLCVKVCECDHTVAVQSFSFNTKAMSAAQCSKSLPSSNSLNPWGEWLTHGQPAQSSRPAWIVHDRPWTKHGANLLTERFDLISGMNVLRLSGIPADRSWLMHLRTSSFQNEAMSA